MLRLATASLFLAGAAAKISLLTLDDWRTVQYATEPRVAPAVLEAPAVPKSPATGAPPSGGILVAEFAPMEAVLVRYPLGLPASLVAAFSKDIKVVVLCRSAVQPEAKSVLVGAGAVGQNLTFVDVRTDSYWTRDYGPWYVGSEVTGNWSIVDFDYNRPRPHDNKVSQQLAALWNVPYANSGLTLTGGNMMGDGKGVGSATYLVYEDNDCGSQPCAKVDDTMKSFYGIDKFLTLADPTGNYIEHMDCWGKFLSEKDVLVDRPGVTSRYRKQYDGAAAFFERSGWTVHRVDIAGDDAYSNSLLLNGKAYVPISASSTPNAADKAALAVYQEALPGYDVVGVAADPNHPWENTDALHCRTRGLPKAPPAAWPSLA